MQMNNNFCIIYKDLETGACQKDFHGTDDGRRYGVMRLITTLDLFAFEENN